MSPKDDNPINSSSTPEKDFSLEDILAEYGGSLEHHLLRSLEPAPEEEKAPVSDPPPEKPPQAHREEAAERAEEAAPPPAAKAPEPPKAAPPPPSDPIPQRTQTPPSDPVPQRAQTPPSDPVPQETKKLPSVPEPSKEPKEKTVPPPTKPAAPPPPFPGFIQTAERAPGAAPRPIPLEKVVGSTVDAVMEESKEAPPPLPRRALFSRKPVQETPPPPPPPPEPEPEPEPIGQEPELWQASHDARKHYIRRKHTVVLPLIPALLPTLALILESHQVKLPYVSGGLGPQCLFLLACLGTTAFLCRHVFIKGFGMLLRRRCVAELLVSLSVLVSALDCVFRLLTDSPTGVTPYASVSCLGLVFAQWGVRRESKGNYDMLRAASVDDDPPYLVTDTSQGACKQRGAVPGFFTTAARSDASTLWQTALLPVFLVAAIVFAALSSAGREGGYFLLNLSAILPAAATFSLPLCWALPWSKLSEHLQKTGCAVAGWSGAQKISARKRMIVTDADLFPPGSVQLSGRRFFNETQEQAVSLAASMARSAGSGLERLFNSLIRSEGGRYEKVDDFSFYDEGGWAGLIKGESVLMGSAAFMRKKNVKLPADVDLKTGVFVAVDRELIAVFSVKYTPSENVDFALKLTQRSHIQPILCSRDPNITPSLIRRKFSRNIHLEYPGLTERIALSEAEKDRGLPRALLFREGLLPYAEAVAGSLRLCKAVRRAAAISLLGSWAGTLLVFYLTSLGAYTLLNPLALELFLLLWTLPVLMMSDWAGRY